MPVPGGLVFLAFSCPKEGEERIIFFHLLKSPCVYRAVPKATLVGVITCCSPLDPYNLRRSYYSGYWQVLLKTQNSFEQVTTALTVVSATSSARPVARHDTGAGRAESFPPSPWYSRARGEKPKSH